MISDVQRLEAAATAIMPESLLNRHANVRQGACLPHWTPDGAIYHVVFRLADSLPAVVLERYRRERDVLASEAQGNARPAAQEHLNAFLCECFDQFLDAGHGECWLAQPGIAPLVADAIRHFESERYELHAWCIMPNHVHVVVRPHAGHALSRILHSWKSFSAQGSNRLLHRSGEFWQKESYDHIIRDPAALDRTIRYVQENPLQAKLPAWPWVWPRMEA